MEHTKMLLIIAKDFCDNFLEHTKILYHFLYQITHHTWFFHKYFSPIKREKSLKDSKMSLAFFLLI